MPDAPTPAALIEWAGEQGSGLHGIRYRLANRNSQPNSMPMPLSDMDAVVHALGDSDNTPAEAVAELKAEIERLRAGLSKPVASRHITRNASAESSRPARSAWRIA